MPGVLGTVHELKGNVEAARRIATAHRQKVSTLDLSGLGMTVLAPEIGQLRGLTHLLLSENQHNSIPYYIRLIII